MKARLKFSKSGSMKFIGHLDIMRYFQKSFRRAGLDVAYSQGYNPHQLISFAAPLGVGLTSDGEYIDMQMNSTLSEEETLKLVNEQMAEGIKAISYKELSEESKNAMSIVAAADYKVSVKDGYPVMEQFKEAFQSFLEQDAITILKKSKKSEREVDIRPFIYEYSFDFEEFKSKVTGEYTEITADCYDNDNSVYLQLATGSVDNLKPELVMEAFCQQAGIEFNPYAYQVHRIEVYANNVSKKELEEGKRVLVALEQFTN